MTLPEKQAYYDATLHRKIRDDLVYATDLIVEPPVAKSRIAVDCGCGAGADIDFLISRGFVVYGFDMEDEAIQRCRQRFHGRPDVILSHCQFSEFHYPEASLVLADASLFFCPEKEFPSVWKAIVQSLPTGGVFCGSFLGPEDTMAGPDYDDQPYWPVTQVHNKAQVRQLLSEFDICRLQEHRQSGTTPTGDPHNWHIYSVVARKR